MVNPLLDKDFLKKLDVEQEKEVYAKVVSLTFEETPIEEITGRITQGSISVDGTSAVRRTCSLSMVAKELEINDYYWGLNTKFSLSIGLKNNIDDRYPDIIWFPQGIYLFTSFNSSRTTNNYTVSLQGKDKMALLNGEVGGTLTALSYDFGTYDETDEEGNLTRKKVLIKDIIREVVHEYAREDFANIIINDLDDMGIELLEYRGSNPMYMFIHADGDGYFDVINMTMNSQQRVWLKENGDWASTTVGNASKIEYNKLMQLEFINGSLNPTTVYLVNSADATPYTVAKIEYGETAGYRLTDITYAGDLIAAVGEAATAVLDKIKNMLGEFEYFYDIDGRFIFQKKKNFVQTSFNNIVEDDYVESAVLSSSASYSFEDGVLISAIGNTPNLMNLKNDYSIWGNRKSVTGNDLPVHIRYAIDNKPVFYKNMAGQMFISDMEIFNNLKETKRTEIITEFKLKLDAFKPSYGVNYGYLNNPIKNADGSFTSGWWDIRDWYEYYTLLTGEEPNGTMKWYSTNDKNGCVNIYDVDPEYYNSADSGIPENERERHGWLVIINKNGKSNWQHGQGLYKENARNCYYYESKYNEDGTLTTFRTTDKQGNSRKWFASPYSTCNDDHTYLEFLEGDIKKDGNTVYFYNPDFPQGTFEEVVSEKIEIEYNEYLQSGAINFVDWREIIYQMAIDYRKHYHEDDFYVDLANNNVDFYPNGKTGYEQYYTDMEGFWRQLYDPEPEVSYSPITSVEQLESVDKDKLYLYWYKPVEDEALSNIVDLDNFYKLQNGTYYSLRHLNHNINLAPKPYMIVEDSNYVEVDDVSNLNLNDIYVNYQVAANSTPIQITFWNYILRKEKDAFNKNNTYIYDNNNIVKLTDVSEIITPEYFIERPILDNFGEVIQDKISQEKVYYFVEDELYYHDEDNKNYWKKSVFDYPEQLNFWIDFLDTTGELGKYAVPAIGNRPKALNDSNVKAIYFRETPTVIFVNAAEDAALDRKSGYTYIQLQSGMENLFSISSQGKSAMDVLDTNLYNHSYCIETISLTSLPIYYLQPNTRIFVKDIENNINGEYVLTRFTIPLNYNGTMSLSATKAAEEIY